MKKINVAVVGLRFGGAFVEIFKNHPNVEDVSIFDINPKAYDDASKYFNLEKKHKSFQEILQDNTIDAVHLVTPIPLHEEQSIEVLEANKHCACTVPMAISLDGIGKITEAVRKSGKNYMMMETTLYTYQFFYVKGLIESGALGKIQFMRGSHYQDMSQWPDYWMGLPPMYYGTHAIGPMVALSGSRIKRTVCFGSGTMDPQLWEKYDNPYPIESALFEFENGLKGEATRSLFETARVYQEGLFVYGSNKCFEWGFEDKDLPYESTILPASEGKRGRRTSFEQINMPNYHHLLPEQIQRFTVGGNYDPLNPQESLKVGSGGGHHGSHPHLVHEFVTSIIENRKPWIDEVMGGNITAAGICAHHSAINGGISVDVPKF